MRLVRSAGLSLALAASLASGSAAADVRVFDSGPEKLDVKLDLYGWVQPRFTFQQSDDRKVVDLHPNPAFVVQRARLGTVGTLSQWAKLQIEVDFSRETANPVDAFLVLTPIDRPMASLNLTAGQFRVPISRQNLLPSKGLQFSDVAYFVSPKFLVDRDIGVMLWGDLIHKRARWSIGVFDGNEPGKGQTLNSDPNFLFAGRLEISPLGPPPRFEGDLRPLAERHHPLFTVAGSVIRNKFDGKHYERNYVGADTGFWFEGASLYGELLYHVDKPLFQRGPNATAEVRQFGWNVQAGYFPPIPWVREHIEVVGRVESFDPAMDVKKPANDSGARELDGSDPTWGYMGFLVGLNFFWLYGHDLKLQGNYEVKNELKACLTGQTGKACTGYINNNLFVLQLTAGF